MWDWFRQDLHDGHDFLLHVVDRVNPVEFGVVAPVDCRAPGRLLFFICSRHRSCAVQRKALENATVSVGGLLYDALPYDAIFDRECGVADQRTGASSNHAAIGKDAKRLGTN